MVGAWDTVKGAGPAFASAVALGREPAQLSQPSPGPSRQKRLSRAGPSMKRAMCSSLCCGIAPRIGAGMWSRSGSAAPMAMWAASLAGFEDARPKAKYPTGLDAGKGRGPRSAAAAGLADEVFRSIPNAPSVGTWRGWGKIFLLRSRRRVRPRWQRTPAQQRQCRLGMQARLRPGGPPRQKPEPVSAPLNRPQTGGAGHWLPTSDPPSSG